MSYRQEESPPVSGKRCLEAWGWGKEYLRAPGTEYLSLYRTVLNNLTIHDIKFDYQINRLELFFWYSACKAEKASTKLMNTKLSPLFSWICRPANACRHSFF